MCGEYNMGLRCTKTPGWRLLVFGLKGQFLNWNFPLPHLRPGHFLWRRNLKTQILVWSQSHHLSIQRNTNIGITPISCPDCISSHQANNLRVLKLWTFYRLHFIIQQRSREHFNLLISVSCNFNNFVTSAKYKFKTSWRWCRCNETCRSAYGI